MDTLMDPRQPLCDVMVITHISQLRWWVRGGKRSAKVTQLGL